MIDYEEEIKELELSELNVNVDEDVEITNDELLEAFGGRKSVV